MKTGKIWGISRLLLHSPFIEVHAIEVLQGGYSSWHSHRTKWNAFQVTSGTLLIQVRRDHGLTDTTILEPGDLTTVKPGEEHRFVNRRGICHALEIYHTGTGEPLALEDIVRSSQGGVYDMATLALSPEELARIGT